MKPYKLKLHQWKDLNAKNLVSEFYEFKGYHVFNKYIENATMENINAIGDELKTKFEDYVILLIGGNEGALPVACFVGGKALTNNKAGDLVKLISMTLGGSGGGRPNMANGRGKNKGLIDEAFNKFKENIHE